MFSTVMSLAYNWAIDFVGKEGVEQGLWGKIGSVLVLLHFRNKVAPRFITAHIEHIQRKLTTFGVLAYAFLLTHIDQILLIFTFFIAARYVL